MDDLPDQWIYEAGRHFALGRLGLGFKKWGFYLMLRAFTMDLLSIFWGLSDICRFCAFVPQT